MRLHDLDEVVTIMQQNVQRVVERGERLDTLQTKTDDLAQGAMQFKRGANKVRRQVGIGVTPLGMELDTAEAGEVTRASERDLESREPEKWRGFPDPPVVPAKNEWEGAQDRLVERRWRTPVGMGVLVCGASSSGRFG
ncbi:hypothetical protein HDU93_000143 [Gonapodya sp. JEL0774]|nr:hypothetical protein HDU93_000143 [Gonapodya sp. JEL0774]